MNVGGDVGNHEHGSHHLFAGNQPLWLGEVHAWMIKQPLRLGKMAGRERKE
jgi:hypothetical protein